MIIKIVVLYSYDISINHSGKKNINYHPSAITLK